MRILQVIHAFPPYSEAGSENYTYALSRALRRLGHEVAVFHRIADPAQEEYALTAAEVNDLPVYRLNNTFRYCDRFEKTYRNADIDARFGAVLDRFRPEVVHFHHLTCLSTSCVFEAKQRGLLVVMTLHDYWLICQRGQFLKRDVSLCSGQKDGECVRCLAHQLSVSGGSTKVSEIDRQTMPSPPYFRGGVAEIKRRLYSRFSRSFFHRQERALAEVRTRIAHIREVCAAVDLFLSPSRFLREQFLRFGLPADQVLFSPYGHEASAAAAVARPVLSPSRPLRFAFTGTVIPPKGIHLLIEAFRTIPPSAARLTIYGGEVPYEGFPEYGKTLRELAAGCKHIVFAGPYRPAEVGRLLLEVDVLVVPSIWYENAPLTIQEAFLARIPMITANLGGMRELVQDGVNGLLFRPRDAADLREKIQQIIDRPLLVEQLGTGAPAVKTIAEDAVTMADRYEKLSALKENR